MDSEETIPEEERIGVRIKILAYLGQLKKDEWASVKEICIDLNLRFSSARNSLHYLADCSKLSKKIDVSHGKIAYFKVASTVIPPEWSDAYGRHPHSS